MPGGGERGGRAHPATALAPPLTESTSPRTTAHCQPQRLSREAFTALAVCMRGVTHVAGWGAKGRGYQVLTLRELATGIRRSTWRSEWRHSGVALLLGGVGQAAACGALRAACRLHQLGGATRVAVTATPQTVRAWFEDHARPDEQEHWRLQAVRLRPADARRGKLWQDEAGRPLVGLDAWVLPEARELPRGDLASNLARAYTRDLVQRMAEGDRRDDLLRRPFFGPQRLVEPYGMRAEAHTARELLASDPYADLPLPPGSTAVCAIGILDETALACGSPLEPLPRSPAEAAEVGRRARLAWPGACDLNPFELDRMHYQHCLYCRL